MSKYISPIFIDFGAKNTGVVLLQGRSDEPLSRWDKRALLVTAGSGKTYSLLNRRQKRHQKRNLERRYMVKRLLRVILRDVYQISDSDYGKIILPNQTFGQFAMGLLNRRGYTFADDELKSRDFESFPFLDFKNALRSVGLDCEGASYTEHLGHISTKDSALLRDILEHPIFGGVKKGGKFPEALKIDEEQRDAFKVCLHAYERAIGQLIRAQSDGHKPRPTYLSEIAEKVSETAEFKSVLISNGIDPDKFANLLGNLSNLQLRSLRKYFNEPSFKTGDKWMPEKLMKILRRAVRSFHVASSEEQQRVSSFKHALERAHNDPVRFLEDTDPRNTIPPFEDQNNRRPQKCLSLLLDERVLDARYPSWREWTRRIRLKHPELEISSAVDGTNTEGRIFQRFLERSNQIDDYHLRRLALRRRAPDQEDESVQRIRALLGSQEAATFWAFCKTFFEETKQARRQVWAEHNSMRVLRVCGTTTPAKRNCRDLDLARLLRCPDKAGLGERTAKLFSENPQIKGRKRLKGVIERLSGLQKELQQDLRIFWEISIGNGERPESLDREDWEVLELVPQVARLLAGRIGATESAVCNPWTLASLWAIISDRGGHSTTCRACADDNFWRVMPSAQEKSVANAVALAADSARPFDGLIGKLVQDQADLIAEQKAAQILELNADSAVVDIVIEENAFSSSEELLTLKKEQGFDKKNKDIKAAQDAGKRRDETFRQRISSRMDRLRRFSADRCPYTGDRLGDFGEIDHILPRSYTLQRYGAVLNHEANLLFVSQKGNQLKKNRVFGLSDIHLSFKQRFYPNLTDSKIKEVIEEKIRRMAESGRIEIQFSLLNDEEQAALRFGLFIDEIRREIIPVLVQSNRVRVNGTQRYLAKEIRNRLLKKVGGRLSLEVNVKFSDPLETSAIRHWLGGIETRIKKRERQLIMSHIIDATIGGLQMIEDRCPEEVRRALLSPEDFWKALPEGTEVRDLKRKHRSLRYDTFCTEVFKSGMYAERFVPVWLTEAGMGVGFREDDLLIVPSNRVDNAWRKISRFLVGKGGCQVPSRFTEARSQVLKIGRYFTVNRKEIFKVANELALTNFQDQETLKSCEAVFALRYFVRKADFFKTVWPDNEFGLKELESIKKDLTFLINFEGTKKRLTLPAIREWDIAMKRLKQECLPAEKGINLADKFRELGHKIFNVPSDRKRRPVRKTFSLPLLDDPSGGFRIKRSNPEGKALFQIQAATKQAKGISCDDHKKFVALPGMISKSLTPTELGGLLRSGRYVSFAQWFDLSLDDVARKKGILRARFRLASKDKPDIEVEVTYGLLKDLGVGGGSEPLDVGTVLSDVDSTFGWDLLGKPRDGKVKVIEIKSKSVVLRYVRQSKAAKLFRLAKDLSSPRS